METAPTTSSDQAYDRNPFSSRRFTVWWCASITAGIGVGIQTVTVPLFIRDRVATGTRAWAIAAALIAQTVPGALLALLGGAVADRIERRQVLVRTYAVAALVSICYVLLSGSGVAMIWPVFPLAAIVGAAGAFTNPARQSMLPLLVERSQLQTGVIFGTMGFMAAFQFLGPSLGGLVAEAFGLTIAFGIEVALLALAAMIFSTIATDQPAPTGRDVLGDLLDGVRYVVKERAILALLFLAVIPGIFFIGPFGVTTPLIVPDVLHAGDKWVGILWGCFGGGVVFGSVLLVLRRLPRRGLAVCVGNLVAGFVLILYGSSRTLPMSVVLLVLWGMCASIFINYVVALLQEHTDRRMLGRVMSMYSLAFLASTPIGYAQAAALTTHYGAQATLVANGVMAAAIAALCLLTLRSVRALT